MSISGFVDSSGVPSFFCRIKGDVVVSIAIRLFTIVTFILASPLSWPPLFWLSMMNLERTRDRNDQVASLNSDFAYRHGFRTQPENFLPLKRLSNWKWEPFHG
jgi:hypothetical protein